MRAEQIKTTARYHYISEWLIFKKLQYPVLARVWSNGNSHVLLARMQNGPAMLEKFGSFL